MNNTVRIKIRKAVEEDYESVMTLIKELAEYEKAPEKVTNTAEQMEREKNFFGCFVAETGTGEIVGMAVYFFAYYTWVGKSLYLDDIYVKEPYRGQKIGSLLMKKVFEIAKKEGCKRVRWQVLKWNKPAIEVYKSYGAEIDDGWLNCTFNYEGIQEFVV